MQFEDAALSFSDKSKSEYHRNSEISVFIMKADELITDRTL